MEVWFLHSHKSVNENDSEAGSIQEGRNEEQCAFGFSPGNMDNSPAHKKAVSGYYHDYKCGTPGGGEVACQKVFSFPAHWDPKLRIPRGQVVAAASIVSPKY